MWVLILSLYAGTGVAVSSVPGFETRAACETAAARWAQGNEPHKYRHVIAVCVSRQ